MENIDKELSNLLEDVLNEYKPNYASLRKALIEEIRNIDKIGKAMGRKLRYFEDMVSFSEVNSEKDIDDFLKDALKGNKYASIYVTGFTQDGNEQYANLENKEINELKNMLDKGLIHKDLFYIVNDWIYFELRLKTSALNEATIVNKFKKTMTLYNAGKDSAEMIYPKYPSAGNRLEKQSGKAVFFFSTMEEAKSYAIAKGIIEHFKLFISCIMKQVQSIENEQTRNGINNYINFIANNLCMDGKIPTIYASHGTKPKFYGIDDSEIMPAFPLASMFRDSLKQSDLRIYVRECIVDTKDIKHGHSADYKEFTVFKPCKVYRNHEFILGQEFSKINVTYLKSANDIGKYPKLILNANGKDKDLFRRLITYKDFGERIEPMLVQESANIKMAEVEVIYDDWEAHCTVWEVGNDISPLEVITIDLPKKFHSDVVSELPDNEWRNQLIVYAKKKIMPILNKKGIKIKKIFLH